MGYRVEYQPIKKIRDLEKRISRLPALTALCLLLFFMLVFSFWPQGAELVKEMVIPGDPDVTIAAMEQFSMQLQEGEALSAAFETFCRNIMMGTQLDTD